MPDIFELDNEIIAEGTTEGSDVTSPGISALENQQTYTSGESECNVEAVDGALALRALKQGEYACAILGHVSGMELRPIQVQVQTETCLYGDGNENSLPLRYWIGIADFTCGSWRWFGPFTENRAVVTVNSESLKSRVKSAANNAYVCVLTGIGSSFIEAPVEGIVTDFPLDLAPPEGPSNVVVPVGVAVRATITTIGEGLATLPAQVVGLSASTDESAVHLTWQTVQDSDVQAIEVLRDDRDDEEDPVELGEVTPATAEYDDETGIPGKEYEYSVRSGNEVGVSADATATIGRVLTAPAAKASDTVPDRVAVSWRASEGAVGYRVFRAGSSEGTPESVGEVAPDKFGWDDSTAETGKTYWYRLQALGEDFDSAPGSPDSGIRQETGERVWWMYGRNEKHNRRSPFVGPQNGVVKWKAQVPGLDYAEAVMDDAGTLFVGTAETLGDGSLYAVEPHGMIAWTYKSGPVSHSCAVAADGTVYVPSYWGELQAVHPSGEQKWTFDSGMLLPYGPAIGPNGTIYVVALGWGGAGCLMAIEPSSGELLWEYSSPGLSWTPAIGDDGTIYVGFHGNGIDIKDQKLYAILPDGELKWECEVPEWALGPPSIGDDGTLYAVTGEWLVAIADMGTHGLVKWQYPGPNGFCAVSEDGVVYTTNDDSIVAVRDDGGAPTLLWEYRIEYGVGECVYPEPAIGGDGTVYIGSSDSIVYAFTPDGQLVWTCAVGRRVEAGPTIGVDGTLYVTCNDGFLYAIGDGLNTPPLADVSAQPVEGDAPLTVGFDGGASYDPDGYVTEYRWDWDEDWYRGYFCSSRENPFTSHEFEQGGEYRCRMQAIDDQGAIGETSIDILVHGWGTRAIDLEKYAGEYCSLADVDGHPAVAYTGYCEHSLLYSRAIGDHGSRWGEPVVIDEGGSNERFKYTDMVIVSGHPAIVCYASDRGDLMYVRAANELGSGWNTPVAVDEEGDVGAYARLAVVNGSPAIVYCDKTNRILKYVRANDEYGESWGIPAVICANYRYPEYAGFAMIAGRPAIAYRDTSSYPTSLVFVRAEDSLGSYWGTPVAVDEIHTSAGKIALIDVSGFPAVSYFEYAESGDLIVKYARACNNTGALWNDPVVVDSKSALEYGPSLSLIDNHPAIAYSDWRDEAVKLATALDNLGDSWNAPYSTTHSVQLRWHPSLVEIDGSPAIVHCAVNSYPRFAFTYLY